MQPIFHFKAIFHLKTTNNLKDSKGFFFLQVICNWTRAKIWINYPKIIWSPTSPLYIAELSLSITQLKVVKAAFKVQTQKAHHRTFPISLTWWLINWILDNSHIMSKEIKAALQLLKSTTSEDLIILVPRLSSLLRKEEILCLLLPSNITLANKIIMKQVRLMTKMRKIIGKKAALDNS